MASVEIIRSTDMDPTGSKRKITFTEGTGITLTASDTADRPGTESGGQLRTITIAAADGGAGSHAASSITVDSTNLDGTETTVQGVLEELETQVQTAASTHAGLITGTHGVVMAAPLTDSAAAASDVTVNADAGLAVAVAADSIYLLECVLRFTAETDGGCGVRVDFTVPANTTITGSSLNGTLFGDGTSVVALDTEVTEDDIGTSYEVKIIGQVVTTDTAGNVGISWAQKDSVDEDLIRKVGSYLKVTLIGANPA